jgi:hypothetical protein
VFGKLAFAVVLGAALAVGFAQALPSGGNSYRFASFDAPWTGDGNSLTTPACHSAAFAFGWSNTNNAGGAAQGEIGGALARSTSVLASYGVPISPVKTFDSSLTASGRVRVPAVTGGGAQWGWYSRSGSTEWRTSNSVLLRVSGDTLGWNLYPDAASTNYLGIGGGAMPQGARFAYNKSYEWEIAYDPATSTVTTTVEEAPGTSWTATYVIPPEMRTDGATFDRFGIISQQVEHASPIQLYLDDVTVGTQTYTFDSDPGWDASNNSYSFTDCTVHQRQSFGLSTTGSASGHADEVGGTIWRGTKAWFADATAVSLTQADTLYAEGTLKLTQATSDADAYVGWFNTASTWVGTPAVASRDAVYASVGSPSRVGFRFTPVFRSSTGQAANFQFSGSAQYQQPLLNARGQSRHFSICYQPNGNGSATLTTTLDADPSNGIPAASSVVQVPASVVASGLSVDRFGLFVGANGGHSVGLWLDDLRYTIEPGDSCG